VQEVAVVGMSVDGLTRIRAVVVLTPGAHESDELTKELQDWCKERLQRYKFPQRVTYATDLPKTTTGKVQRFRLRHG
jgi:acyl-coenzyme A synthetase/AMP-(fatty) acid ligase